MRAAAGLGLGLEVGATNVQSELDWAAAASIQSLGTTSLGVRLIGARPLLFSLSDSPGVKEHRLRTWGHVFI